MRLTAVLRVAVLVCAVAAAAHWMLSDTFARYSAPAAARPLRVSFWGAYEEFEMWKQMLANFRREHPGVPVNMEYFPSRYDQKIGQLLVADDAPDVILYQDEPFPNIIESDPARNIQPKFENLTKFAAARGQTIDLDAFWKTAVEYFGRWEGEGERRTWNQYGMPIWGGCNLFFYNRRCFADCGVRVVALPAEESRGLIPSPDGRGWLLDDEKWTLDEFLRLCRILTVDRDGDGRTDQFALSPCYTSYWLPIHYAFGADVLTDDLTHTAFDGPAVEASLGLWQDVMFKYHVTPRAAELGQMGEAVGFFTGRVAMFCSGPWGMPFLNASGADYDVLHVPRSPQTRRRATRITWDSVCMGARSRNKDKAWLLIRHLTSLDSMRVVSNVQRSIPARKAAAEYFQAVNPKVSAGKFVEAAGTYARKQPVTKYWSIMERAWSDAMSDLRRENADKRLTPAEAIGKFYSDSRLMKVLPPARPDAAETYRELYRRRIGQQEPAR